MIQFENYREKKEEEFAHFKDRRLALRNGKKVILFLLLYMKISVV